MYSMDCFSAISHQGRRKEEDGISMTFMSLRIRSEVSNVSYISISKLNTYILSKKILGGGGNACQG